MRDFEVPIILTIFAVALISLCVYAITTPPTSLWAIIILGTVAGSLTYTMFNLWCFEYRRWSGERIINKD